MNIIELKAYIEKMKKNHQVEILRILKTGEEKLNENKSGIFVNLSSINSSTLENIYSYVTYLQTQENSLSTIENTKDSYKNEFFSHEIN
jgi:predicted component of viral defense system (DUF524 family)